MEQELQKIDAKKRYADDIGEVRVMGFVENYVVFRRKGACPSLDTLNGFAKRFREVPNVELRGCALLRSPA